ncbi:MAG: GNAT family N-acetyltransferase [Desulfobacterales bacterium]|nr:GNAT family N-acetyltransferase [Desulfobacterales bacterium]
MLNQNSTKQLLQQKFDDIKLRFGVEEKDINSVKKLVEATGFFNEEEIEIAQELVIEGYKLGEQSSYRFIFADYDGWCVGYTCYGRIPCTLYSYDLYWIVVHPQYQGKGIGKILLKETESMITKSNGKRIYVETSMKAQYRSTRQFYERCGYGVASILEEFYGPGDAKVIYNKIVHSE